MTTKNFFSKAPNETFNKNRILIHPNEPINKIFYLTRGSVKQYLVTPSGDNVVVHVFSKGSYFPIALLLGNKKNRYYFTALGNVKVRTMDSDKVVKWLKKEPAALVELTSRLASGLEGMVVRLEGALEQDLHERLLSLIKYLSGRFVKNGKKHHHISIPLSHKELASWLGVSRETVSRAMKKLEKEGRLTYKYRKVTFNKNQNQ
jgi:CRP/FNR family transcriptional regulator, anaerobic regulatory protein